ncbi:hypothetical protein GNI_125330 [Gregarina niphandrodes]|uniref:Uncharacterized protein n=1 Tax=Gregarina niphandrodes TaxID=110365 RepID=A0A023B2M1_GRENI|nr:hypothetical protein GNI_125330 [Gregarina niphandrodes]EZG50644.1 hypothetical protein GNI_125330 [Gregarina niphandrodes]|eukprot:XP_011131989.1 hypothetical protein GNI_125330 [Gregarina niphandrodes]
MDSDVIVAPEEQRMNVNAPHMCSQSPVPWIYVHNKANIVLGPVIGLVTHDSVRFLVESDQTSKVNFTLVGRDRLGRRYHRAEVSAQLESHMPKSIYVDGLRSNYKYTVQCDQPMPRLANCCFKTLPRGQSRSLIDSSLRIALVSGNDVSYVEQDPYQGAPRTVRRKSYAQGTEHSLWRDLYQRICDDNLNMVIHVGNNLQVGGSANRTLFADMVDDDLNELAAFRVIQQEYYKCWTETWARHVLGSCSNVMIFSESDIGNLVKNNIEDKNPQNDLIARATMLAYRCYQQALWHDPHDEEPMYAKHIELSRYLSLLLVDFTTYPTLETDTPEVRDLFPPQTWKEIEKALPPVTRFDPEQYKDHDRSKGLPPGTQKGLLVVSTATFSDKNSILQDPEYLPAATAFLNKLFEWKTSDTKNMREVCIVSAASRASGYASGSYLIEDSLSHTYITEFAVAPMAAPCKKPGALRGLVSNIAGKLTSSSVLTNGPFTFAPRYMHQGIHGYGVLTFGALLGTTTRQTGEVTSDSFLTASPVFWVETFQTRAAKRPLTHEWAYFQHNLTIERTSCEDTYVPCPNYKWRKYLGLNKGPLCF